MSQINWAKMPDATHFHPQTSLVAPHWFKPGFFCVTDFESEGWVEDRNPIKDRTGYIEREEDTCQHSEANMFGCPECGADFGREGLVKPAWTGEGLPPVGTVCEWRMDKTWKLVEIRYLSKHTILAALTNDEGDDPEFALCPDDQEFRPIRTAEQIAAEEREHSIRNACTSIARTLDQFRSDAACANAAKAVIEALYDAGYRKQEQK